jgi:hypothetical protein
MKAAMPPVPCANTRATRAAMPGPGEATATA